jgi:hypothetical protein
VLGMSSLLQHLLALLMAAASPAAAKPADSIAEVRALMAAHEVAVKTGNAESIKEAYAPTLRVVLETGAVTDQSALLDRFRQDRAVAPALIFSADRVQPLGRLMQASGTYNLVDPGKRLIKVTPFIATLRPAPGRWEIFNLQFLPAPAPAAR